MHAAVVRQFDLPPRYESFDSPVPTGDHDELVEVLASGLHPRVRSQANGSHYTSTDELPLIPGIDGVGRRSDGSLVYFILPDTTYGAMAERTVIDARRSIPLPSEADPLLLAAAMNPAMSSWVALRQRISLQRGQSVLILGATGSAGQLAVQIAKHLGAGLLVAAGRGAARLAAMGGLGADETIDLAADPEQVAHELADKAANVDVVLDYLWGKPAESAIMPLLTGRDDRARLISWVQIGAVAGAEHQPSLRCAAPGQHSFPRQRAGFGQCRRHPLHAPGARRRDRQRSLRGRCRRQSAVRRGVGLERLGRRNRAHRARALTVTGRPQRRPSWHTHVACDH